MHSQDAAKSDLSGRTRKVDRHDQIVLELKLRPHVRISEMARRFGVSAETIRRDMIELSITGQISREHGGASAPRQGHHPSFGERNRDRLEEREQIGRMAATLVEPGQTLMIDSGSTTFQMARFLAGQGTECTVVTNSLEITTVLGSASNISVILCPGTYLPGEAAVIGPETNDFLSRHRVDLSFIGATALTEAGVYEAISGFSSIKRMMLLQGQCRHLLADTKKFGRNALREISPLSGIDYLITNKAPGTTLSGALSDAGVEVMLAAPEDPIRLDQKGERQ